MTPLSRAEHLNLLFLRWAMGWRLYELGRLFRISISEARDYALDTRPAENQVRMWYPDWREHDVQPRVEGEA